MLQLKGIKKDYAAGGGKVAALRGIDLRFRQAEFVSILGPSGCGKTTMLNIIGGLDGYTQGDLIIRGVSTKKFRDRDWDAYRNHSIGFVFQNYHLIPHQSVLQNVELALTLSGVSRSQRRARAKAALERVGLGDQLKKRPNEMSGGQMQRVAIARALVNDPDIILADEPTGALDTETSLQIMELLKEVARDRLVIMVTHNPELAETYSTRIIRMLDGKITGDSDPVPDTEPSPAPREEGKTVLPSMSFGTSFMLSLKNLFTKKGRTVLTAFAGSIGIIGIALIISLSTGIQAYIDQVQEETLSSYPITIQAESADMTGMMTAMMGAQEAPAEPREEDLIYSSTVMYEMMNAMLNTETTKNDLVSFKKWLDAGGGDIHELATVHYSYDFNFGIYTEDAAGDLVKSDMLSLMNDAMEAMYGMDGSVMDSMLASSPMSSYMNVMNVWTELLPGKNGEAVAEQVKEQYDLIHGTWPQAADEVVLFVTENNELPDMVLCALGLISNEEMKASMAALTKGETPPIVQRSWSFEELCSRNFKLLLPSECFRKDASGKFVDLSQTPEGLEFLYRSEDTGLNLKIVGIARPDPDVTATMISMGVGYTSLLTEHALNTVRTAPAVTAQLADPATDILTALPFATGQEQEPSMDEKKQAVRDAVAAMTTPDKAAAYMALMSVAPDAYVSSVVEQQVSGLTREIIEQQMVGKMAQEMGWDETTVRDYVAQMSDEQLFAQVRSAMEQEIRAAYAANVAEKMGQLPQQQLAAALDMSLTTPAEQLQMAGLAPLEDTHYLWLYKNHVPAQYSQSTYEETLELLGYVDEAAPAQVNLYAVTFADKDLIADRIAEYNRSVEEDKQLEYTDYVALLMSSVTAIISGITYLLIAFVAISLVVSSIMIGVITLISVQERTREIGILRAMGASKKEVAGMFNAETVIVGLFAGSVGVILAVLLTIPINAILLYFTGLPGLRATLPLGWAVGLTAISALLTVLAGFIPSRSAAKKDPVVALRTE